MKPCLRYLESSRLLHDVTLHGPARAIEFQGRKGINTTSVRSYVSIPRHTATQREGSLTFWVLALEDLSALAPVAHIRRHEGDYDTYTLLSDHLPLRDVPQGGFALVWSAQWYPQLGLKFFQGVLCPDAYEPTPRAAAGAGHFHFRRLTWYQCGVTWSEPKNEYSIFVNGVCVATANRWLKLQFQPGGATLYLGNPALVFSDLAFYDRPLDDRAMAETYRAEATQPDTALDAQLRHTYLGADPRPFTWQPDADWRLQLESPLNRPAELDLFYVQGNTGAPRITPDGLLVHTPWDGGSDPQRDFDQVYLWTKQNFEGDLALEFEFMPLQHQGLSLLMLQANGMQREDLMADYPLRTSGAMTMVAWENVRNYHWEFFREQPDTRHDVGSHALIKQPW